MGIPLKDVQFLRAVTNNISQRALSSYIASPTTKHGVTRAAQALILRFEGPGGTSVAKSFTRYDRGASPEEVLQRLERFAEEKESSLNLLLIRRAEQARDRWSGHVTFPGGRRDKVDIDDRAAAIREVTEELGFPLDAPDFVCLGRLPDYQLHSRNINSRGLVMSRFVFLHIGEATPVAKLARYSVQDAQWVPVEQLRKGNVRYGPVRHRLWGFFAGYYHSEIRDLRDTFGTTDVIFPSISLPRNWQLWGIGLQGASDLNNFGDRERFDWPLCRSDSPVVQHIIIDPYHGYLELFGLAGEGRLKEPWHVLSFVLLVGCVMSFIVSVVATFGEFLRILAVQAVDDLSMRSTPRVNDPRGLFEHTEKMKFDRAALYGGTSGKVAEPSPVFATAEEAQAAEEKPKVDPTKAAKSKNVTKTAASPLSGSRPVFEEIPPVTEDIDHFAADVRSWRDQLKEPVVVDDAEAAAIRKRLGLSPQ